jgi:hypothetical protein
MNDSDAMHDLCRLLLLQIVFCFGKKQFDAIKRRYEPHCIFCLMPQPSLTPRMKEEDVSETTWKLILITIIQSLHPRSDAMQHQPEYKDRESEGREQRA